MGDGQPQLPASELVDHTHAAPTERFGDAAMRDRGPDNAGPILLVTDWCW